MSNSTYCDDHYEQPLEMKEIGKLEKQVKQLTKDCDQAYDFILELVHDDPSTLCEVVDENYPEWCNNNCGNFNRDCLQKFFAHYKKED